MRLLQGANIRLNAASTPACTFTEPPVLKLLQIVDTSTYKLFMLNLVYKQQSHSLLDTLSNYGNPSSRSARKAIDLHLSQAKRNQTYSSIKILGDKAFKNLPKDIRHIMTERDLKEQYNYNY